MGWASGAELAARVWEAITPLVKDADPAEVRRVAADIVDAFEDADCDTLEEIDGPLGDVAHLREFALSHGAPADPREGEEIVIATGQYRERFRFDGRRWGYADSWTVEEGA